MPAGGIPAGAVEHARADLADRFGYPPGELEVALLERRQWPDAHLGCPPTGATRGPGPVDGYLLVLQRGDLRFRYHGADGELPRLCQMLD
ncbi:MAG TPA: hypothetical protein VNU26_03105 [Mycobacteriales bacterium]|nr:hypothetical protein [Mycobacteriales bacterium]